MFVAALRQLGDHDLTFTQLAAMVYLLEFPAASLGHIAAVLGRSLAATGRMANDLVKAGLVTRTESAADRRVKELSLTAKGRAFIEQLHRRRAAHLRVGKELVQTLSDHERAVVHHAMTILARHGRI